MFRIVFRIPFDLKPVVLVSLSFVLGWTVFQSAGVAPADWNVTVLALAVLTPLALRGSSAPRVAGWLIWPLTLLPLWVLFQIVPLPAALVRVVSPARAELASAFGDPRWIPISAFPAVTLSAWMRLVGCVLVFLIVRELAWRYSDRRSAWVVVLPVIVIASLEAVLGLVQVYTASADSAHGTYANRDHFAGLMEMALPFPVIYGCAAWRRARSRLVSPVRPALILCGSLSVAALLLLGSVYSLSRMGFIAAIFGLGVLATAAVPHRRWLVLAPVIAILLIVYLPTDRLIERFEEFSTADKVASLDRLKVWRETLPMVSSYAATGCGLRTFQFVFPRFKRHAPLVIDNFAHNDYLQYLTELGIIGFSLGVVLIGGIMGSAAQTATRHSSVSGRALGLACLASLAALLLHSLVDFNTYIPANAFACAWICAIAASGMYSSRAQSSGHVLVLEAKAKYL